MSAQLRTARNGRVIGPLKKRVNFAHALLHALDRVETDYVLVVQHDRVFSESISMNPARNQKWPAIDTVSEIETTGFVWVFDE